CVQSETHRAADERRHRRRVVGSAAAWDESATLDPRPYRADERLCLAIARSGVGAPPRVAKGVLARLEAERSRLADALEGTTSRDRRGMSRSARNGARRNRRGTTREAARRTFRIARSDVSDSGRVASEHDDRPRGASYRSALGLA